MASLLQLPEKTLLYEFATGYYPMDDYSWSGRLVKASDAKNTPVAWTLYQQAIFNDFVVDENTEQDFIDAGYVPVVPPVRYGMQNSILRLPKTILLGPSLGAFASDVVDLALAPIIDSLKDAGVVVIYDQPSDWFYGSANHVWLNSMFLPPYSEQYIEDFAPVSGALTFGNHPVVRETDWVAGEILYIEWREWIGFDFAVGCEVDSDAAETFFRFTNNNNHQINQLVNGVSRYKKFGHYTWYNLCPPASQAFVTDAAGWRTYVIDTFEDAMGQVDGATWTLYHDFPGTAATPQGIAHANGIRSAIVDFFGL